MGYSSPWFPLLALVLFMCYFCEAKYNLSCSSSLQPDECINPSMKPSNHGVKGRYIVEWCTNLTRSDKEWNLRILFNQRFPNSCSRNHRDTHSVVTEYLDSINVNCSSVCLSTEVDVIFSACYRLENSLTSQGSARTVSNHNISNGYSIDTFARPAITGKEINHGDYVSATFFLGALPATKYFVELCNITESASKDEVCSSVRDVFGSCALAAPLQLRCRLALAPGAYRLDFRHRAPWAALSPLRDRIAHSLYFNVTGAEAGATAAAGAGAGWRGGAGAGAAGALAALLAAAALVLAARAAHTPRRLRHRVLTDWLNRSSSKGASPAVGAGAGAEAAAAPGPVLLLYAREGPRLQPVVDALAALLDTVAPGQVYDLYSARTTALAAAGGDSWVRALLARPNARLLLLQTPALRALHTPAHGTEEPLLSSRAVYRVPLAGDRLLPLVLRLARQEPRPSYRKYYLATMEGLETEALPYTVPFRRYALPAHAAALLRHLQPAGAGPGAGAACPTALQRRLTDELALATRHFVDHARDNPHYLMDQLIIV